MSPPPPRDRRGFTIAIICALTLEADAILSTFDVVWSDRGRRYGRALEDENSYTPGVIGEYNVVLAHMPGMGTTSAATVANNLRHSFPNIKLALVVGICGGVPNGLHYSKEIYLGDLVVSTGVVQYDFGRQYPGIYERKDAQEDNLSRPSPRIRGVLAKLKTEYYTQKINDGIVDNLEKISAKRRRQLYPGRDKDCLYEADYIHKHRASQGAYACIECRSNPDHICPIAIRTACADIGCDRSQLVDRTWPSDATPTSTDPTHRPAIHFGRIGSGNTVIKSGDYRDQIAERDGIIAFEMEGAGIWEYLPGIIVKGVCDYADSHKSKDWQDYAALVAAAGAKAILREWEPEQSLEVEPEPLASNVEIVQSQSQSQSTTGKLLVPFARDPRFVQRGNIIQRVDHAFRDLSYCPRVVLTGLGGVGKSQIAIEYGYHWQELAPTTSIFWVYASNPARFRASYQSIARELQLPGQDDPKNDPIDLLYRWLQNPDSGPWLLILDNIDYMELLHPSPDQDDAGFSLLRYLPQRAGGAVLVTSRDYQVAVTLCDRQENVISVPVMSEFEAHKLISTKLPPNKGSDADRARLFQVLDYLPLAITQAAAFITRSSRITVAKYIEIFAGRESDSFRLLTDEHPDLRRDWQVPHSVFRTWEVSFTQIQSRSLLAANLLSLMACFDRQGVPEFLIEGDESPIDFDEAIELLLGYAFISMDSDTSTFSTHRLVQYATRAWLKGNNSLTGYQERALDLLTKKYPEGHYEDWVKCSILEPHIQFVLQPEYRDPQSELNLAHILSKRALYHLQRGNFTTAGESAERSVEILDRILGPENFHTLHSKHYLSLVLGEQGYHERATNMAQSTLEARRRTLGPEHPSTLISLEALALSMYKQGQLVESMQLYRNALSIRERVTGMEKPETLNCINNLAMILVALGQLREAEQWHRTKLATSEKLLGQDHPSTLMSVHNLADVLRLQYQYGEAERLFRRTLSSREKVLGKDHPDTIGTIWALAKLLRETNAPDEAYQLYEQAATGFLARLGPDHPYTITTQREYLAFEPKPRQRPMLDYHSPYSNRYGSEPSTSPRYLTYRN